MESIYTDTQTSGRVPAIVGLASSKDKSLLLNFEAIIDGYAGPMPLLWDGTVYRRTATVERPAA